MRSSYPRDMPKQSPRRIIGTPMKQVGFSIMLVFALAACSPREDGDAKSKTISIDKAQIDIAKMNQVFKNDSPSTKLPDQP